MLTFLFLLILFFILWPVIKAAYAVNKARNQARDFFNQARTGYNPNDERPGGWSRNADTVRPKIFTRDMGEYVDFEEIDSSPSTGETSYTRTTYSSEPFVTDAEWEDIDSK